MLSRECCLTVSDLSELYQLSKGFLKTLNEHLPDRAGGSKEQNFEKAHIMLLLLLHKVLDIVMWGWSENESCQGHEHAHIDLIKSTSIKEFLLCILRYHFRHGHIQQYEQMLDMLEADEIESQSLGNGSEQDRDDFERW